MRSSYASASGRAGSRCAARVVTTKVELEVTLELGEGKRAKLNGAPLRAAEQLRSEVATLVFTPDRLSVVKGGPAVRRAYFDRVLGRLSPARASLSVEYGAAIAQRNAALRRAAARLLVARDDRAVDRTGCDARDASSSKHGPRRVGLAGARFRRTCGGARPAGCAMTYEGRAADGGRARRAPRARPRARLDGPRPAPGRRLLTSGSRDLRSFGSQGEQRLTVLALLLAEAELIAERRGVPPLLLLDDVLSELDSGPAPHPRRARAPGRARR